MEASEYVYRLPEDYEFIPEDRARLDALVTSANLTEAQAQEFVDLHVSITNGTFKLLEEDIKKTGRIVLAIFGFLVIALIVAIVV